MRSFALQKTQTKRGNPVSYTHLDVYKRQPVDSEGTATGENDYYANCGIGTAILKDSMSDEMKDFISYVWDNFADTAMYEFNMLPSMMPSDSEKLPELTQQILSDLENCGTFAQCWDVRLDPSTNEVYRKEPVSYTHLR